MRIACSKIMTKGNVLIFKRIFSTTCNPLGICMDVDLENLFLDIGA